MLPIFHFGLFLLSLVFFCCIFFFYGFLVPGCFVPAILLILPIFATLLFSIIFAIFAAVLIARINAHMLENPEIYA
jgi:hypothetical protein